MDLLCPVGGGGADPLAGRGPLSMELGGLCGPGGRPFGGLGGRPVVPVGDGRILPASCCILECVITDGCIHRSPGNR